MKTCSLLLLVCLAVLPACGHNVAANGGQDEELAARVSGEAVQSLRSLGVSERSAAPRAAEDLPALEEEYVQYIMDGVEASVGAWPFAASFLREIDGRFYHFCGGSLVQDRWVLTAAHCKPAEGHVVILGRHDLRQQGGVLTRVESVITHPSYNPNTKENDIALVRIGAPGAPGVPNVRFGAPPAVGQQVTAIGWGALEERGPNSAVLRQVSVPVWEPAGCRTNYAELPSPRPITASMVCAGEQGKDSCQGDSGGPLLKVATGGAVVQVGVVSFGVGCGRKSFPGVYTRVDRYLTWIRDNAV